MPSLAYWHRGMEIGSVHRHGSGMRLASLILSVSALLGAASVQAAPPPAVGQGT